MSAGSAAALAAGSLPPSFAVTVAAAAAPPAVAVGSLPTATAVPPPAARPIDVVLSSCVASMAPYDSGGNELRYHEKQFFSRVSVHKCLRREPKLRRSVGVSVRIFVMDECLHVDKCVFSQGDP